MEKEVFEDDEYLDYERAVVSNCCMAPIYRGLGTCSECNEFCMAVED